MWKKVNPGMEYVIAAMRRIAAERGKECHATMTTGQAGVTGRERQEEAILGSAGAARNLQARKKKKSL